MICEICEECPTSIAQVQSTRAPVTCACGEEYRPATVSPPIRPTNTPALLPRVLADLAAAARYQRTAFAAAPGGPRAPRCPVGALQGHSDGAERDASERQVTHLWGLVNAPGSRVGKRARAGFVDALLEHCEETSRPEEPDWAHARACALRLDLLRDSNPDAHRALRALQTRVTERASWAECARVVAEALAPAALVTAWGLSTGRPGRPRADEGMDRVLWGGERLGLAVRLWVGT